MCGEDIEPDRVLFVGGVKDDYILHALLGDPCDDVVDEISVGVEERKASTGFDVLGGHGCKQGALASPRGPDDVTVPESLLRCKSDGAPFPPMVVVSQHEAHITRSCGCGLCASAASDQVLR